MKYEKPRNPAWPDWYDGKKINEVQFCYDFLESHPLKCIDGQFYTPDGPVEDESEGYFRSYSPIFTVHKFLNQHTTLKRIEVKFYEVYLSQHDTEDTI